MKYFLSSGKLFRLDAQTQQGARWDEKTKKWLDVGLFIFEQAVLGMDPTFVETPKAQVREAFPDSLDGDQTAQPAKSDPEAGDDFAALTVEQMANAMGVISSDGKFGDWFPTSGVEARDAPAARKFWDLMVKADAALNPGQTLAPPSEWS